jgi:hypothetical protein
MSDFGLPIRKIKAISTMTAALEVLDMAGDGKTTENEIVARILKEYVPTYEDFYTTLEQAFNVLHQVKQRANTKHGVTFVVKRTDGGSGIDSYVQDNVPYNGRPHNLFDKDIVDVASEKSHLDGACIVDNKGNVTYAGVILPINVMEYKRKYGIEGKIQDFLGEGNNRDGIGARKTSALYASDVFQDVMIFTLHEPNEKGDREISIWYRGNRVYNSAGREMNWEMAKNKPAGYANVILFPEKPVSRAYREKNLDLALAVL